MDLSPSRVLVWFSCGAASAVAAALAVKKYGERCEVVTCDTRSTEHPDNERFLRDVERWIGRSIRDLRSVEFASIDEVYEKARYMSGHAGARCTVEMKKVPRLAFQRADDLHVFGFTFDEAKRAADFEKNNAEIDVEHILIDERVTKEDCYTLLTDAGIRLPEMYALGFDHNNCIGCVKATSPDYWNLVRKHFPEVYARRAAQSEALGVRLARVSRKLGETLPRALPERRKGKIVSYRVFLSVLPPDAAGGGMEAIECGPVCQTPATLGENGFDGMEDLHNHVARVDLSTPEKRHAFDMWKDKDGTKPGLVPLLATRDRCPLCGAASCWGSEGQGCAPRIS